VEDAPPVQEADKGDAAPGEAPEKAPAEGSPAGEETPSEQPGDAAFSGLFSPRSGMGWEDYTVDRLDSELHRCASNEQDLVFFVMEFKNAGEGDHDFYRRFAGEVAAFFTQWDLIFERGAAGVSIICPGIDLDEGLVRAENFRRRAETAFSGLPPAGDGLCVGLSSRAGRMVDARRLMLEASQALERALGDPASGIVAFRSDPEKYREYLRGMDRQNGGRQGPR
jgi:hypothetical protein